MQLEEGNSVSPYNMLENSSFERVSTTLPSSWTTKNTSSADVIDTSTVRHGDNAMMVTSSVGTTKYIRQDIDITGTEADTYIISGWGYGKGVRESDDTRKFKIAVKVTYDDNYEAWRSPAVFNTSETTWQYASGIFYLSDGTDTTRKPVRISVYLMSYGQANTVYFDHIQLIRTDSTVLKYDTDGNVIKDEGGSYTYDENGNMLTSKDLLGKVTNYTYDSRNNLTDVVTSEGVATDMTYDSHGNVKSAETSKGSLKIKTEKEYDATGSFVKSDKDENGYEASYSYDAKGLLISFTDRKGQKTAYAYNSDDLLQSVTSSNKFVSYSYNSDNRLDTITTPSASYSFVYDGFGNRTSVRIGNSTVSSAAYEAYNGNVSSVTLSNGYKETYTYDEAGRVISVKTGNNTIEENVYRKDGLIDRIIDHRSNTTYRYEYDLKNRVIGIHVSDNATGKPAYGAQFGYDSYERLSKEVYYSGNHKESVIYIYGDNGLVSSEASSSKRGTTETPKASLGYTYDDLERLVSKTLGTSSPVSVNYTYKNADSRSGYTTSQVLAETIDDISYTYTYDKNGNITSVSLNRNGTTKKVSYTYDKHNQLTEEENEITGETYTYKYDDGGNIIQKTTGNTSVDYKYTNTGWKDQLSEYNGSPITYDSIGNPISYRGYTFTWNGRELTKATKGDDTIEYEYD